MTFEIPKRNRSPIPHAVILAHDYLSNALSTSCMLHELGAIRHDEPGCMSVMKGEKKSDTMGEDACRNGGLEKLVRFRFSIEEVS
jgi:ketol-acid reductoisomerase